MTSYLSSLWPISGIGDEQNVAPKSSGRDKKMDDMSNSSSHSSSGGVGEISKGKLVSLNRRHAAAMESKIQVEFNTHKILPSKTAATTTSPKARPINGNKKTGSSSSPIKKRHGSNKPKKKAITTTTTTSTSTSTAESSSERSSSSTTKDNGNNPATTNNTTTTTTTNKDRMTMTQKIQDLSRLLQESRQDQTSLKQNMNQQRDGYQTQLEKLQEEKEQIAAERDELASELQEIQQEKITFQSGFTRLQQDNKSLRHQRDQLQSKLETKTLQNTDLREELKSQKQNHEREKLALQNQIHELQQTLMEKSQESSKRMEAMMAGQEQLEKALDLVKQQNKPWWQCH